MARIEDIERRLNNWARWKLGGTSGGLGFSKPWLDREGGGYSYREAVIPIVDCEAEETDRGVQRLDDVTQETLEKVYIGSGSLARKSVSLGVSESTIHARVWEAHRRLASWFSELRRLARDEQRRVELLQRSAVR